MLGRVIKDIFMRLPPSLFYQLPERPSKPTRLNQIRVSHEYLTVLLEAKSSVVKKSLKLSVCNHISKPIVEKKARVRPNILSSCSPANCRRIRRGGGHMSRWKRFESAQARKMSWACE